MATRLQNTSASTELQAEFPKVQKGGSQHHNCRFRHAHSLGRQRASLQAAFRLADDVLHQGIQGISELITVPGLINLDFADVRTIMSEGGAALMAVGRASGEDRARLAAGPSIARNAREQLQAQPQDGKVLRELADGDLTAITAQHVARAAEAGDELACRILEAAARALGKGLANAITLMNPQRVILGGGVTESGERYWRAVRQAVRDHVLADMTVDIAPAALGHDAPLWGGILLAAQLV